MSEDRAGLIDRTLRGFRVALRLGGRDDRPLMRAVAPELPEEDAQRVRGRIDACLEARGGEVSARARAAELGVPGAARPGSRYDRPMRAFTSDTFVLPLPPDIDFETGRKTCSERK